MQPEIPYYEEPGLMDFLTYLDKPFGDQQLQEAGFVSGLRKLLNMPISRREFLEGAANEVTRKDSALKTLNNEIVGTVAKKKPQFAQEYYLKEILSSLSRPRKPILQLGPERGQKRVVGPWEQGLGEFQYVFVDQGSLPYNEYRDLFREWVPMKGYHGPINTDEKYIRSLYTLLNTGNTEDAAKYAILRGFKDSELPKRKILNIIKDVVKEDVRWYGVGKWEDDWNKLYAEWLSKVRGGLKETGIEWDMLGRIKLPKDEMKRIESLVEDLIDKGLVKGLEAGSKAASKVGKKVGEKEVSRREFMGLKLKDLLKE